MFFSTDIPEGVSHQTSILFPLAVLRMGSGTYHSLYRFFMPEF